MMNLNSPTFGARWATPAEQPRGTTRENWQWVDNKKKYLVLSNEELRKLNSNRIRYETLPDEGAALDEFISELKENSPR